MMHILRRQRTYAMEYMRMTMTWTPFAWHGEASARNGIKVSLDWIACSTKYLTTSEYFNCVQFFRRCRPIGLCQTLRIRLNAWTCRSSAKYRKNATWTHAADNKLKIDSRDVVSKVIWAEWSSNEKSSVINELNVRKTISWPKQL